MCEESGVIGDMQGYNTSLQVQLFTPDDILQGVGYMEGYYDDNNLGIPKAHICNMCREEEEDSKYNKEFIRFVHYLAKTVT